MPPESSVALPLGPLKHLSQALEEYLKAGTEQELPYSGSDLTKIQANLEKATKQTDNQDSALLDLGTANKVVEILEWLGKWNNTLHLSPRGGMLLAWAEGVKGQMKEQETAPRV
jgi:hypothetical protein